MEEMDKIEDFVRKALPRIKPDVMVKLMSHLEDLGVETPDNLIHLKEEDFKGVLNPIQVRTLIATITTGTDGKSSKDPAEEMTEMKCRESGICYIGRDGSVSEYIQNFKDVYILFASEKVKAENEDMWAESFSLLEALVAQERQLANISKTEKLTTYLYADTGRSENNSGNDGITIHHYRDGTCMSQDVKSDMAFQADTGIARSNRPMKSAEKQPNKRASLKCCCPSGCSTNNRSWQCEKCKDNIIYGFDESFYCKCGKGSIKTLEFKCNSIRHKQGFQSFQDAKLTELLNKLTPIPEINLLLLGETGVGKSTWINGFVNYLTFGTLEEAEHSPNVCLIPTFFTMTNDKCEETIIRSGVESGDPTASPANDRDNEVHTVGESATQKPKSYVFFHNESYIRIIDTPGIGDVRGIEQDKKNFESILHHISHLDKLHGICILLKPNNARLGVMFRFCVKELLVHLHYDACKNILFCFTNARSTFYAPGDTLPPLKKLLEENQTDKIKIPLCPSTVYCMDNEAVRFLAAVKCNQKFDAVSRQSFSASWLKSVDESCRMLEYISTLTPHQISMTMSLNEARSMITMLARPLAEISNNIKTNIDEIEKQKDAIQLNDDNVTNWEKSVQIKVTTLVPKELGYPRTVCANGSCVTYEVVNGKKMTKYTKICHDDCSITDSPTNIINCVRLQSCGAMGPGPMFTCTECGCSWAIHMHITYELERTETTIRDTKLEQDIKNAKSEKEKKQLHEKSLKERVKEMKQEEEKITEVSAKFACFLKHNAIAPYNDAWDDYLQYLIQDEKNKKYKEQTSGLIEQLEKMRKEYAIQVATLEEAIKKEGTNAAHLPKPDDITGLVDSLYGLKINGPTLKETMNVAKKMSTAERIFGERVVAIPNQNKSNTKRNALQRTYQTVKHAALYVWETATGNTSA